MSNRDWGFWTFWIAIPALAISGGLGLISLGHPVGGRRLFYAGLIFAALLVLGLLAKAATETAKAVSNPLLKAIQAVVRFVGEALVWFEALLLSPVIHRVLSKSDVGNDPPQAWTAFQRSENQNNDFLTIARPGHRLAGGRFVVRPDRSSTAWHAGFRLTSAIMRPENTEANATVLFEVSGAYFGPQQGGYASGKDGIRYGPYNLPASNTPTPSYQFDFSISSYHQAGMLWVSVRIDQQPPQGFEFREEYAEQLVLVAWAQGKPFRVHFEQISVSWVPHQKRILNTISAGGTG